MVPLQPQPPETAPEVPAPQRRASVIETVRVVAWSFIGIRRRADHDRDAVHLHPLGVIGVGIGMAAIFVLTLVAIVRTIVG
jgi:hypothetical protein